MKIDEYQDRARKTAIYPREARVGYPALGVVGELGELDAKVRACADASDIAGEIGDVLWYCANLCCDLEAFLSDCFGVNFEFNNMGMSMDPPNIVSLGTFAENCKKLVRDGDEKEKREVVFNFVAYIIRYLNTMAKAIGVKLDDIAAANLDKLESRQERGVLQGDGDSR